MKKNKQTIEHIRKRVQSRRRNGTYVCSEEQKKKISQSRKGKYTGQRTMCARKNMSIATKRRYEDPLERLKTSIANKKAYRRVDVKRRHKQGCKNNRFSQQAIINAHKTTVERQHFPYQDTSIELKMRKLLDLLSIKYVPNYMLYEDIMKWHKVDIMILDHLGNPKIAIECDGCYWHGCPVHYPENIRSRDMIINLGLFNSGIDVIRLWECEINNMELSV